MASRNPALLVAAGTRARLELARGIAADVVRGNKPGPLVWLWATRGADDPALQQALCELRDALDPTALRGAIGFLVDGFAPPLERDPYARAPLVRKLSDGASAIVLLRGCDAGERVALHAEMLEDASDRRIARAFGPLVVPSPTVLNRDLLSAPAAWLIAGEVGRVDRAVTDRVREALRTGLSALSEKGMELPGILARVVVDVPAPQPGLVEPLVTIGAWVRRGTPIASVGSLGLVGRQLARAPLSGVVLRLRAGRVMQGRSATVGAIAKLSRAPQGPRVEHEVGWCELVDLPDLGVLGLPAKIDTGARTSALHVTSMRQVGKSASGRALYEIEVPAGEHSAARKARVEIVEQAVVRDSGGHAEKRLVIETGLQLGARLRTVRVSLADRGDMRFPMLVGRTALDEATRIAPAAEFVTRPRTR
ncbi:MAG: RimK/LysX family protein [Polyangia bacterium]